MTTQALMSLNVVVGLTCSFLGLLIILGCFPTVVRRWVVAGIALGFCAIGKFFKLLSRERSGSVVECLTLWSAVAQW